MRKTKKTLRTTIDSREALESVMGEYAKATIDAAALQAEMESRIAEIRTAYEVRFADLGEMAEGLLADIEAWAAGHPEAFADRKSLELLHGTIGFRTSTPRVALPRGTDENGLATQLADAGLSIYTRTLRELDRQRILADCANPDDGEEARRVLAAYGIRVAQSERFFAEVRREDAAAQGA